MVFQIGEKVVYSNQGIGTVESISERFFGVRFEQCYLLRLVYTSMTVLVPFSNVTSVGLRKITASGEIARILTFLACQTYQPTEDWKNRFKKNTEKMQSGNLSQVAEVLKSLLLLQRQKALSFREKKMLDRARQMLVAEISIARRLSDSQATTLLAKTLAKAHLELPAAL